MSEVSPSWRSIRVRSNSLPRTQISRRNSPNRAGVRSWVRSWAKPVAAEDFDGKSESPLSPTVTRRTPLLTLALLKLEENLLQYCRHLQNPSFENASAACALLDSSVATASPISSDKGGSPRGFVGSPASRMSSPRSPIRSWLTGSGDSPLSPISSSATALEGEWEKFIVPFFLLAGAETVYASLGHANDTAVAQNLSSLYQRIIEDLKLVRTTLCDPFLAAGASDEAFASFYLEYYERATSLSSSLRALAVLAQSRCRLIQIQSILWDTPRPKFGDFSRLFHDMLPNLPPRNALLALPMLEALEREVNAWKFLCETCHSLETCMFAETILSAQKTKGSLNLSSNICLQVWFRQTLQHMVSILPVFFDRIGAFAKHLYGFENGPPETSSQHGKKLGDSEDLESMILDFLRRQEKAGPAMAITVVLDAEKTDNLRIERGFAIVDGPNTDMSQSETHGSDTARFQWPAIYMRTTAHRAWPLPGTTTSGLLGGRRGRPGSRSHEDDSTRVIQAPSSNILRNWSNDGSPPTTSGKRQNEKQLNVLEYAPELGSVASSWPHSSWSSLVAILTGTGESRNFEVQETSEASIFERFDRSSISTMEVDFLPKWPKSNSSTSMFSEEAPRSQPQTSLHIAALSDYMWLVVMVKVGEDNRWHRRRGKKVVEEEAREFLNKLAPKLRVSDFFCASHAQKLRRATMKSFSFSSSSTYHDFDPVKAMKQSSLTWNQEDIEELLQYLKGAFRLRSPRSSLKSPYNLGFGSRAFKKSPKFRHGPYPQPTLQASAVSFFLGPELAHMICVDQ